jgi:hypothetical protein
MADFAEKMVSEEGLKFSLLETVYKGHQFIRDDGTFSAEAPLFDHFLPEFKIFKA